MRAALCIGLTLLAAPAWAEWTRAKDNAQRTSYMDLDFVKVGDLRRGWMLLDFKNRFPADQGGFHSGKIRFELDCKEKKARMIEMVNYAEPMLRGEIVVHDKEADEWGPIPPDSDIELMFMLACGK